MKLTKGLSKQLKIFSYINILSYDSTPIPARLIVPVFFNFLYIELNYFRSFLPYQYQFIFIYILLSLPVLHIISIWKSSTIEEAIEFSYMPFATIVNATKMIIIKQNQKLIVHWLEILDSKHRIYCNPIWK